MSKRLICIAAACGILGLVAGSALSWRTGKDGGGGDFSMYVAPGTIATSAACTWVTIHTDVRFLSVEDVSADVNDSDVPVAATFADDRGNLVVKLRFGDVVDCGVAPPTATVTLTVVVIDNDEPLVASETVPVKK